MKQAADVLRLEKETAEKLAAKAFAKSYLADLVPSVFNNLRENGFFYDPVQRDLENGFMPWIIENTMNELDQLMVGRLLLDSLLRDVVIKRNEDYKNIEQLIKEQRQKQISIEVNEPQAQESTLDNSNQSEQGKNDETLEASNQDDVDIF